ncbi:MAG: multicopper oxidase domain-containing protein, partial [bacterium]
MKSRMLLVALILLLVAVGALLFTPERRAAAENDAQARAAAVEAAHRAHLPPTQGSGLYQYDLPVGRHFDAAQVFNPAPPPPGPAPNGIREYTLVIQEDVEHEVAPGIKLPAWTFNRTVPGPVLRAIEGETLRITVVNNGTLPHTIHFHGIHPANMDGVFELIPPGGEYTYEFVARPFGIMPYHCHSMPTSQHIHNGLYGMLIIDPKGGRKPMRELAMA